MEYYGTYIPGYHASITPTGIHDIHDIREAETHFPVIGLPSVMDTWMYR